LTGEPVDFNKVIHRRRTWFDKSMAGIAAFFLAYVTLQNVVFSFGPQVQKALFPLEYVGRTTMTIQTFRMFSQPPLFSPWFEYRAVLTDGSQVDLFDQRHVRPGIKPISVYRYLGTQKWRRVHWNLITNPENPPELEPVYQQIRKRLLTAMVRRWDQMNTENQVDLAVLKCHLQPIDILEDKQPGSPIQTQLSSRQEIIVDWAGYQRDN
jgi:hypothetical protein